MISIAIAIGLAAWAFSDDLLIGGGQGIGWTQSAILLVAAVLAASCLAPPEWQARVLVAIVSTGLTLAIAELSLRYFLGPRYYAPFQLDARSIYRLAPGVRRDFRLTPENGGALVRYSVNSAGFRGEELDLSRRAVRIAVYGDSFIQAEFSPLSETFVERLEQYAVERIGTAVEAVNAGVAGYGPDQVLLKMEDELVGLAPDLVLVAVFAGNDFGDLLRNKLFRIDEDGALQANAYVLDPSFRRQLELSRHELFLRAVSRYATGSVAAVLGAEGSNDVLRKMSEEMTPSERVNLFLERSRHEYDEYVIRGDPVVRSMTWDAYDADVSVTPQSDSARYKVALMDAVIGRIQNVAEAAGVPLALVVIPSPVDVCGHEIAAIDRSRYPDYRPRGLTDVLAGIAQRRAIPYVDLFDSLEEHCGEGLFMRGMDDHWNAAGQDVGARTVADRLASAGLLRAAASRAAGRKAGGL